MDFEQFQKLSEKYNVIPVFEIITADLFTPVLAYLKIREAGAQSFLLESVEGSASMARYSYIGKSPLKKIYNKGDEITIIENGNHKKVKGSIFQLIKSETEKINQAKINELPDFTGGIVGFIGYENISLIESTIKFNHSNSSEPDSILGLYDSILVFDHFRHQIILICNAFIEERINLNEIYNSAKSQLKKLRDELNKPIKYNSDFRILENINSEFDQKEFINAVNKSRNNISEGDVFQIVLSRRFSAPYKGDLLNVYRALRIINPSPYMYFLEFQDNFTIIGTSPEDLLKVKSRKAQVLPIAGTRRRGATPEEDKSLEENLINDPKEKAEHTMLVDLGRNDLGRVCEFGSIKVTDFMRIQKYSHVIHLVSKVEGVIRSDNDPIDVLMSCFPAGTVTGAPKIRAVQLINEYERDRRNVYAGAVGYVDFSQNLDMCIAIRTLFAKGNRIYWQAGAGIVADSNPELEMKEIKNKSAAMVQALKYAEVIDDNISY